MRIVIDIPEAAYKLLQSDIGVDWLGAEHLLRAVSNGTPLPKGHGDLIDRNDLLKHHDSTTYHNGIEERKIHFVQIGYVNDAPAIIEADKAESECAE